MEWVPIPGSAKARLLAAAIEQFESRGYEAVNVAEVAAAAGVTTGSLYHHFASKLGLYTVVRDEMEKRITERMLGAGAAVGGPPRAAARAALLVAFDAAVRFKVVRILGESPPNDRADPITAALREVLGRRAAAGPPLAAAWRAALLAVAAGTAPSTARTALEWILTPETTPAGSSAR